MKPEDLDATICAIATATGSGAVGIVRLSGPEAFRISSECFQASSGKPWDELKSRYLHLGQFLRSQEDIIDQVLMVSFPNPTSYTGEDMIEFHAHGSSRILREILAVLNAKGARVAQPGEFTQRAFLNGKIDLAQAEAVQEMISAETLAASKQALRHLQGNLSGEVKELRDRMRKILAHIEVDLDFPEENIDAFAQKALMDSVLEIREAAARLLETATQGKLLRDGALVVIIGRPNVGKSSLLNALLDQDRAIITSIPGTTRDPLEESLEIEGILIRLVDTAGIRETSQEIEKLGIEKSQTYLERADLILFLLDSGEGYRAEDEGLLKMIGTKSAIAVWNKSDLLSDKGIPNEPSLVNLNNVVVSARDRSGFADLKDAIASKLLGDCRTFSEGLVLTLERHRKAMEITLVALDKAVKTLQDPISKEFTAFELRQGLDSIGLIIGETYTDDLLDIIFRDFCLGK